MSEEIKKKAWWRESLIVFARVSGAIAVPVLIGLFAGRALDNHFGTKPWLLLASLAVGFAATCIGIVKIVKKQAKKMEEANNS